MAVSMIPAKAQMTIETNKTAKVIKTEKKQQSNKDLKKTRMCTYFLQGHCGYGADCTFAHCASEVQSPPDLTKTQLCSDFAAGRCTNPDCTFAHGEGELKDAPNFKKKLCKWNAMGKCRNGTSCGFAHAVKDLRVDAPPGFEPLVAKASQSRKALRAASWSKQAPKIAPPPGLTMMSSDEWHECDSEESTMVPSKASDAESEQFSEAATGAPPPPVAAAPVAVAAPRVRRSTKQSRVPEQPVEEQDERSTTGTSSTPEESYFRFMAGRGSAPLQKQISSMNAVIGGLQSKLSQLQDMMLQSQVAQMQQTIEQLTEQCQVLEAGLQAQQPQKTSLSAQAAPFKPSPWGSASDDSTSVGSE